MKIALFTALIVFMLACGPPQTRERIKLQNDCTIDTANQRAAFILRCIEAGNPKSDEEPEDWIGMCQDMAEDTLCQKREFIVIEEDMGSWWKEINRRPVSVSTVQEATQ